MKNLTKIIILTLTTALLPSCAATPSQPVDDNTVVGDSTSIIDDSNETSQSADSSDGEGVVIDLTEEKDENWLKAPEGFDSFSYDREIYYVTNHEMLFFNGNDIDYWYDEQLPFDYNKYFEEYDVDDYVYIKARLAGDSINILSGKCGDTDLTDDTYVDGAYSPVIIEEIVDTRGNDVVFETCDTIYVGEYYKKVTEYYVESARIHSLEYIRGQYERHPDDESWAWLYESALLLQDLYEEHLNDNWVHCENIYPMEKGKSYLILVKTTPIEGLSEECPPLYETGFFNMNLSDDEPDSYGEDNDNALLRYGQYKNYWHACKELYGEYFE